MQPIKLSNRPRACSAGLLAAAVLFAVGFASTTGAGQVRAQDATATGTPDTSKKISLTVTQAPIQSVLKTLFGSEGVNYTIDADVQGNVTVDINEVTFDTALHALLRSTNPPLTYDIENGNIYHIKVKPTDVGAGPQGPGDVPPTPGSTDTEYNLYKIPIDRYDATVIAALIGNGGQVVNIPPNYTVQGGGGSANGRSGISGGATTGLGGGGGFGSNTGGGFGSSTTSGFGGGTSGFGGSTGGFGATTGGIGGTTSF